MPHRRCLDCRRLTTGSNRCANCSAQRKKVRNAHAAALGPCPQDGRCWICGGESTEDDPFTWDHIESISRHPDAKPFARRAHRSCNSGRRDRW